MGETEMANTGPATLAFSQDSTGDSLWRVRLHEDVTFAETSIFRWDADVYRGDDRLTIVHGRTRDDALAAAREMVERIKQGGAQDEWVTL